MIKMRASGSPLKRLETCETADHYPQVQILFVCTISFTTSLESRFYDCLSRPQESCPSPLVLEASSSTSSISTSDPVDDANSVDFVARVSTIPLVNTALRAYEQTKASSKVVKVRIFYFSEPSPSSLSSTSMGVDLTCLVWRRNDGIICKNDIETSYWSTTRHSTGRIRLQAVG